MDLFIGWMGLREPFGKTALARLQFVMYLRAIQTCRRGLGRAGETSLSIRRLEHLLSLHPAKA